MAQETVEVDRRSLSVLRKLADSVHNEYGSPASYRAITEAGKALGEEHPLPQGDVDNRMDLDGRKSMGQDIDEFLGWLSEQPHADEDTNVNDYR